MSRRIAHLFCSLWLLAASLLPGAGWALCVEETGHVAIEIVGPAGVRAGLDEPASACRTQTGSDACTDCHDVRLSDADPVCPRRDLGHTDLPLLACVAASWQWPGALHTQAIVRPVRQPLEPATRAACVLRC